VRCHSCGTEVHDGQKFCAECGASLRGVADVTGEVPVIRTPVEAPTREMATVPPPPPTRPSEPELRAPVAPTIGPVDVAAAVGTPLTMPPEQMALGLIALCDGVQFFYSSDPQSVPAQFAEDVLAQFFRRVVLSAAAD